MTYQERKANIKRVFLRHDYRNKVIKLHNSIERLVTNRPLLKVSPLEAKEERECIDLSKCGSRNLWGTWAVSDNQNISPSALIHGESMRVWKTEPVADSWETLAMAFHDAAAVQSSAEYHQSVKSSS